MSTAEPEQLEPMGPWNPGLTSQLPRALMPLSTLFRPENVRTTIERAEELGDFTGLAPHKLVAFRPERLVVHELLIRVTADLSVPDGTTTADLGINFRRMTETLLAAHIAPRLAEIADAHRALEARAAAMIAEELAALRPAAPAAAAGPGLIGRLAAALGRPPAPQSPGPAEPLQAVAAWQRRAKSAESDLERAVAAALAWAVTAVLKTRGRLPGDLTLVAALAGQRVGNEHGSELVGETIAPIVRAGAAQEGYRLLPAQAHPMVMNIKGASAAGKSSMRGLQRRLAERLGVDWADFALISPDIWRKYLLDYDSLGAAYRYAGTLTGHEIEVIDRKLDRYMARKAERGAMTHLLIDRFRFDSFTPEGERGTGGTLLTRFGELIYMFFMITPPEATVERAWARGLKVGRYKAVDDLLDHNVEAYTGMPHLFFTWALRADKRVHYEFLDNSVPEGTRPRTVAFGWNGEMNIVSVKRLLDVARYRKINIEAKVPEEVYPDAAAMAPENNTSFLADCARRIPAINFLDEETGCVYARLEGGALTAADREGLAKAMADRDTRAALQAIAGGALERARDAGPGALPKLGAETQTLGRWGPYSI